LPSRHLIARKDEKMTANHTIARKLYLFQLSTHSLALAPGRTLEMVLPCYLLETSDGRQILIDTGYPADIPRPAGSPPAESEITVLDHLAHLGLNPADVDLVIATHFDIDHVGYHDSFPNAEFIVQREHYDLARSGHARFSKARHHWDHPSLRYRLLDGDTELLPGLTLLKTSGHVAGHQSILVRLPQTGPVLLAIDAVMMKTSFTMDRKPWPHDDIPEQLLASTRKLLDLVQREGVALVVFGHDGLQWQNLKKAPAYYD
jgi:N-acyl homoserine lactone hydrolase